VILFCICKKESSEEEKMEETIINVDHVSMRFNLASEKTESLKEYFVKMMQGRLHFDEFYALKDVSFQVRRGEAVALIGSNGSGKSTMLKTIAGVMYPSKGNATVHGDIAPLIELGAGFDMDLTARENIYLNGAVLGHDRAFMDEHFQSIVEFAELWEFIDVPVKNFSSGMIARLGFAIATEVKADVLIVDEILAVGDHKFQEKCHQRMAKMLSDGTTLLLVSHNDQQVRELCDRAIWLNHGVMMMDGPANEVCDAYMLESNS
jgi:ABC-type polysaccharide/polyol phosphate transport system ATPase subunit